MNLSSNGGHTSFAIKSWRVAPRLSVTPDTLNFGTDQTRLHFTLKNEGSDPLDWTNATDGGSWLSADPLFGALNAGQTSQVYVDVDREQFGYGSVETYIDFSSNEKIIRRFIKAAKAYAQLSFFTNITGGYSFYKPLDIEFAPESWGVAFAADYGNQTVAVMSPLSHLYTDRIVLGFSNSEPANICIHPSQQKAFVACPNAYQIRVVDDLSVIDTLDVSSLSLHPYDCVLSADASVIYIVGRTTSHNGKLAVVNTTTGQVIRSLDLEQLYSTGDGGPHIALVNGALYITNYDNPSRIYVIDEDTFAQSTITGSVPLYPHEMVYNSGDNMLYVSCGLTGNNLLKVNPQSNAVVSLLPMENIHSLTIGSSGKWKDFGLVTSRSRNKIYSVYLPDFKVVQEIETGNGFGPAGIAVNPAGDEIWVTGYDGNLVKVYK